VEFRRSDRKIGSVTVDGQPGTHRNVEVPQGVQEQGGDWLVLRPLDSATYSAAAVLVLGLDPSSESLARR
jgi:hypothetical protein